MVEKNASGFKRIQGKKNLACIICFGYCGKY